MVKEIWIGTENVMLKSSAALPILYRELTGREFFRDLQGAETNGDRMFDLAWVMYRHANPEDKVGEAEWLGRFEMMDLNNHMQELADMISAETRTESTAKKKDEP